MSIDLTLLTPEQLDKYIHVQSIVAGQEAAAAKVRALRAYYDGEHPVYLSARQQEFIGKMMTEGEFEFSHNTVKSVVDTLRERLNVSGFTINGTGVDGDGDTTPEQQLAAVFWAWWEENRYDAQQIRLHRRAIRDGKSYVMVDYDAEMQRPRLTLHQVDDGTTGIVLHRDPECPDKILFANKYFTTFDPLTPGATGKRRKTTYLPGEIRKYIGNGIGVNDWQPYREPGDSEWPIRWWDKDGAPLGIPIIEFENPGDSEVAQIIGLQDLLNKSWLDLIAAADTAGFPILAIEDADPESFADAIAASEEDDDIEGDELFMAPGRILDLHGAQAHRIESGDLSQLINVIRLTIETIAGISRTPQYYLAPAHNSDNVSGEALKQLDSGLVKRAKERQLIFGQSWADVMVMAYKVERTFGDAGLPEVKRLKVHTQWSDPETRNDKSEAETGEIYKRLNVPDEEIWAKLGFSPQQIARFRAMQRTDQAATTAAVMSAIQQAQATAPVTSVPGQNGAGVARVNGANGNGVTP